MSENLLTKQAFADSVGVTRQAVLYAIKQGHVRLKDGRINADDPINKRYKADAIARKKKTEKGRQEEKKKIAKNADTNSVRSYANSDSFPEDVDPDTIKADYQIEKLKAQTSKINLDIAKTTGEVVLRDLVDRLMGRLGTTIASYLLTMGDRVTPELTAVTETIDPERVLQIKTIIDKDITKSLNAVKATIKKEYEERLATLH